jgi:hypothetical protein
MTASSAFSGSAAGLRLAALRILFAGRCRRLVVALSGGDVMLPEFHCDQSHPITADSLPDLAGLLGSDLSIIAGQLFVAGLPYASAVASPPGSIHPDTPRRTGAPSERCPTRYDSAGRDAPCAVSSGF